MARRRRDPLLQQAEMESQVQYGAEEAALRELAREARQTLRSDIASEAGVAQGIKYAIAQVQPEMIKAYGQAAGTFEQARTMLQKDLGALGPQDPYRAAASVEAQGARHRLAEGLAEAEKELSLRKLGAEQGRAFAVRSHLQEYRTNIGKIRGQQQSVRAQKGAFTAATFEKLQAAAQQQALAERRVSAQEQGVQIQRQGLRLRGESLGLERRRTIAGLTGRDPATGRPIPGGKGKGPKSKFNAGALKTHQKLLGGVQDASAVARRLRSMHLSFDEIGTVLTGPKDAKHPYGGYGPYTARAGVELVRDGHLSDPTFGALRGRGLIGHRTPRRWRPPAPFSRGMGRDIQRALTFGPL